MTLEKGINVLINPCPRIPKKVILVLDSDSPFKVGKLDLKLCDGKVNIPFKGRVRSRTRTLHVAQFLPPASFRRLHSVQTTGPGTIVCYLTPRCEDFAGGDSILTVELTHFEEDVRLTLHFLE